MDTQYKIRLAAPGTPDSPHYFPVRIKRDHSTERAVFRRAEPILVMTGFRGNFHTLRRLLVNAKVIDKRYNWTFDEGHLVVLGDCFTKDGTNTEALWLLYGLEERAKRSGGYVHTLVGSQEVSRINGTWINQQPPYTDLSTASRQPHTALYQGNGELRRWLCSKNMIEKVGDVLLVSDAVEQTTLQAGYTMAKINQGWQGWAASTNLDQPGSLLAVEHTGLTTLPDAPLSSDELSCILDQHQATTLVMGKSTDDTIASSFEGRLITMGILQSQTPAAGLLVKGGQRSTFNVRREIAPL